MNEIDKLLKEMRDYNYKDGYKLINIKVFKESNILLTAVIKYIDIEHIIVVKEDIDKTKVYIHPYGFNEDGYFESYFELYGNIKAILLIIKEHRENFVKKQN